VSLSFTYPTPPILRQRATQALHIGVGLANPMWFALAASTSVGVALWAMTRWARPAVAQVSQPLASPEPPTLTAQRAVAPEPDAVVEVSAPSAADIELIASPLEEPAADDDLTVIAGIGPRTAEALRARGVRRFSDLAAWTPAEMAQFDAERKLLGRGTRDAWIAQAKRLAYGD